MTIDPELQAIDSAESELEDDYASWDDDDELEDDEEEDDYDEYEDEDEKWDMAWCGDRLPSDGPRRRERQRQRNWERYKRTVDYQEKRNGDPWPPGPRPIRR